MNYYAAESNERRTRQNALWITVSLYVALSAVIYLQTGDKPTPKPELTQTTTTTKAPTLKARPVALP